MPSGTNATGQIYGTRQASAAIVHSYPVNFDTAGIGSGILVDVIKASVNKPVHVEVSAQIITAFNAVTTNVLTAGTTLANANEWLAGADITEGTPGYYPASNAVAKFRLTADTSIFVKYTQSGGAATTGAAIIFVREFSENTTPIV